jgi:hypothetical protein
MPKLNAYTDDPGYFIRAWISDAGNVTYQVKPMAELVLTNAGYGDGDDLPWSVIRALRAVGFVHTGSNQSEKYADQVDNFEPDGEILKVDNQKANEILEQLETNTSVSGDALDRARSALGVDTNICTELQDNDDTLTFGDKIKNRIHDKIESTTECESIPFDLEYNDWVSDPEIEQVSPGTYRAKVGLSVLIGDGTSDVSFGLVFVNVYLDTGEGISNIEVVMDPWKLYGEDDSYAITWETRADVNLLLADLLPIMRSVLEEEGYTVDNTVGDLNVSVEHL